MPQGRFDGGAAVRRVFGALRQRGLGAAWREVSPGYGQARMLRNMIEAQREYPPTRQGKGGRAKAGRLDQLRHEISARVLHLGERRMPNLMRIAAEGATSPADVDARQNALLGQIVGNPAFIEEARRTDERLRTLMEELERDHGKSMMSYPFQRTPGSSLEPLDMRPNVG